MHFIIKHNVELQLLLSIPGKNGEKIIAWFKEILNVGLVFFPFMEKISSCRKHSKKWGSYHKSKTPYFSTLILTNERCWSLSNLKNRFVSIT